MDRRYRLGAFPHSHDSESGDVMDLPPSKKDHIIDPTRNLMIWTPGMHSTDVIAIAALREVRVYAMCGHNWVPSINTNPEVLAVCDECLKESIRVIKAGDDIL